MTIDCGELHACADMLHAAAAAKMDRAVLGGRHQPTYVEQLRVVEKLEETAAVVERRIDDTC